MKPRGPIQLAPREIVYEAGDLASARVTVCITLYNYAAFVIEALGKVSRTPWRASTRCGGCCSRLRSPLR